MQTQITRCALKLSLTLCAAMALSGCNLGQHTDGGGMNSGGYLTYVSTSYQPKTITVLDTRDGEELWSVDVPVGQKLVIHFYKDQAKNATPENPDLMKWAMGDDKQRHLSLRNSMPVPPASSRRIDMTLRAIPEWPQANASD